LSVRDLRVEYMTVSADRPTSVVAVDRVSFDIAPGQIVGLAGESGCGKSTIAQAILRTLRPPAVITGGQVLFGGRDVLQMSEDELRRFRWKQAAIVFQSAMNVLNPVLTVGEQLTDVMFAHDRLARSAGTNATAPAALTKLSREAAIARAETLLVKVGLPRATLDSFPHQLSGGMRQRVVIAIAMALEPKLLIMDEPTTALDVVVQREILDQIAALREQRGFSILFITHDLSVMFEFVHELLICYAGKIAERGPARTLLEQPRHPYSVGLLDAFPDLHGPKRELLGIPGCPPSLHSLPSGCAFHPRCASATEECRRGCPPSIEFEPGHLAQCHHPAPRRSDTGRRSNAEPGDRTR
jgi:peptide/nickel transport system ATP-binding protein